MKQKSAVVLPLLVVCMIAFGLFLKNLSSANREVTLLCPTDTAELFETLAEAFRSENDGARIVIEKADASTYGASVEKRLSDKTPPDITVFTADTDISVIQAAVCLADLSALLEAADVMIGAEGGEPLYFLPLCGDVPMIFYNRQLFDEKRLSEPEDLNQFISVCSYFEMLGICPLGISADPVTNGADITLLADCILGNAHVPDPGNADADALDCALSDLLSFLETLNFMEIFSQGYAADRDALFETFRDGDCAMIPGRFSDISTLDGMDLPFQYGAFLLFGNSMTNKSILIPSVSISVSADAGQTAWDLAEFLLSAEGQQLIRSRLGAAPIRKDLSPPGILETEIYARRGVRKMTASFLAGLTDARRRSFLDMLDKVTTGEFIDPEQLRSSVSEP